MKFFAGVWLLLVLTVGQSIAQPDSKSADGYFRQGNYPEALKIYTKLLQSDPSSIEYNLRTGICHLKLNEGKTQAIPYLEKVIQADKFPAEAHFYLGMAYQYDYRFDKAEKHYQEYLMSAGPNREHDAVRQIETCRHGRELVRKPLNITFENLGSAVNSAYPDYYPIVPPDESFMVFTSRRKSALAQMEFDGFYSSDIYMASSSKGQFENAKMLGGGVNTSYDEQAVGLSADGDELFIYIDHLKEFGDIYLAQRTTRGFGKVELLGPNVNSKEFETSGTISSDGNTMFFASRREGGTGGTDLYMSRKLPTGEWGLPQNLGPVINTGFNEDFPFLLPDGKTLFFASQGHQSMGGYDIFTSQWDDVKNIWSPPRNVGYPINTPEDNMTIYFSDGGRTAYTSAVRKGGYGDLDIYRVIFQDKERPTTVIRGLISSGDSVPQPEAIITVTDPETEDIIGTYLPNPVTSQYVIILPPGRYNLMVEADGFKPYAEQLLLHDYAGFQPEMIKDYNLSP